MILVKNQLLTFERFVKGRKNEVIETCAKNMKLKVKTLFKQIINISHCSNIQTYFQNL